MSRRRRMIVDVSDLPTTYGWLDGEGEATTEEAIRAVKAFSLCPTIDGGVQIEFASTTEDVEVSIGPDGRITGVAWLREASRG